MRYTAEQKQQTHDRIVAEAARLFRADGYASAGVDAVMKAAGLTAGGFYAHFRSKDALLIEAMEQCKVETGPPRSEAEAAGATIEDWIDRYLSTHHRDRPGKGCPLPALAAEIARQPKAVRKSFTATLRKRIGSVADRQPTGTPGERSDAAISMLASVVGAVMLARAVDDEELSERILDVMKTTLTSQVMAKRKGSKNARARERRPV